MAIRPMSMSGGRVMGVPEAAVRLHVSDRRVRYLLKRGQLRGIRLGRQWAIKDVDIKAYLAERSKRK